MGIRVTELHCKEVVCVCDGARLGFVSDVELDLPTGQVCAIIVPGRYKFWGMFCCTEDLVIPWHCIRRIGGDILLVDCRPDECRRPRSKKHWLNWG